MIRLLRGPAHIALDVGDLDGNKTAEKDGLKFTPILVASPSDDVRDAINNRTTEKDHAKVRDMIVSYVKNTGNKVMVCAEMTYEIELGKEVLVDPLPADVKKNVVWRDTYWLPDEAASIYSKAQALVSLECHSPLIAYHNGTPAFEYLLVA